MHLSLISAPCHMVFYLHAGKDDLAETVSTYLGIGSDFFLNYKYPVPRIIIPVDLLPSSLSLGWRL